MDLNAMSDDDEGGTANVAKTAAPMVDKVVATLVSDFMLKIIYFLLSLTLSVSFTNTDFLQALFNVFFFRLV